MRVRFAKKAFDPDPFKISVAENVIFEEGKLFVVVRMLLENFYEFASGNAKQFRELNTSYALSARESCEKGLSSEKVAFFENGQTVNFFFLGTYFPFHENFDVALFNEIDGAIIQFIFSINYL